MNVRDRLNLGADHQKSGRLAEAEEIYRQVISENPANAEALHLLGSIKIQGGNFNEAIDLIRRAIAIEPGHFVFHRDLGRALVGAGRQQEAVPAFATTLRLNPQAHAARFQLGNALGDLGRFDEAIECSLALLKSRPNDARIYHQLGNFYHRKGLNEVGLNEADVLNREQNLEQAVLCFEKAIALDPNFVSAGNNLAVTLWALHRRQHALNVWRRYVNHAGNLAVWHNLGRALTEQGLLDEAFDAMQHCFAIDPNEPNAINNLANIYRQRGQIPEAIEQLDRAIAIRPNDQLAHSNRLYNLYFHQDFHSRTILVEHARWNELVVSNLPQRIDPHPNVPDPNRKLKIGYVSPNYYNHCQSFFTIPLFSNHDREKFAIYLYSDVRTPDDVTTKIRSYADNWQTLLRLTDDQAAEQIRADGIDILVDLTLHMAENRLLTFARKPAPVQVTWLGYPGTTGLTAMDYRLTDPHLDPPAQFDSDYVEKSIRLPDTFWCLDRDALEGASIPPVNELPVLSSGRITFGSLNNFAKVNKPLLKLWKRVLAAVTGSRILVMAPEGYCRNWIREELNDRADFVWRAGYHEYLQYYHRIDIGLDTHPYNGHTTTLDSLWMGVPVVSLVGRTVVGRAGFSQYSNLELTELATNSGDEFVRTAVDLAHDLPRLSELRRTLRDRMRASPLLDGARFARDVESAFRRVWQQYCEV
jgi:protein O-GlcNAc transferase